MVDMGIKNSELSSKYLAKTFILFYPFNNSNVPFFNFLLRLKLNETL